MSHLKTLVVLVIMSIFHQHAIADREQELRNQGYTIIELESVVVGRYDNRFVHAKFVGFVSRLNLFLKGDLELSHLSEHLPSLAQEDRIDFLVFVQELDSKLNADLIKKKQNRFCNQSKRPESFKELDSELRAWNRQVNRTAERHIESIATTWGNEVYDEFDDFLNLVMQHSSISVPRPSETISILENLSIEELADSYCGDEL